MLSQHIVPLLKFCVFCLYQMKLVFLLLINLPHLALGRIPFESSYETASAQTEIFSSERSSHDILILLKTPA